MVVVVLALFWLVYSRYLLPMADRLEQAGLTTQCLGFAKVHACLHAH